MNREREVYLSEAIDRMIWEGCPHVDKLILTEGKKSVSLIDPSKLDITFPINLQGGNMMTK